MDGALHVLVVDDDPDTALFVRTVLQRGGMAVTTCADPLEALALASRSEFDAAITDIEMPGMSGLESLDRLRQLRPAVPRVARPCLEDVFSSPSHVVAQEAAR
ncbi:response regulator [Blastococcus sp. SYSU DS0541]